MTAGPTMREKMLAGELYRASDPELAAMRTRAEHLVLRLDRLESGDPLRASLLDDLFGALGPGSEVRPGFRCDYGSNIFVGRQFYANYGCVILDCARVTIGDRVLLAPNVQIYAAAHPIDVVARSAMWEYAKPVTIGDDVWVGGGAIVCPGVSIGSGSVIGAGSVVTRDVPAGVVAAGNPCRVLRPIS